MKDTIDMQRLRAMSSGLDLKRPAEDRVIERYFEILTSGNPDRSVIYSYLPHSDLVYIRAALEAKFPDRIFSFDEIKTLVREEYGAKYT